MELFDLEGATSLLTKGNLINLCLVKGGARRVALLDCVPENESEYDCLSALLETVGLKAHPFHNCDCGCGFSYIPISLPDFDESDKVVENLGYTYTFDDKLDCKGFRVFIDWVSEGHLVFREMCCRTGITIDQVKRDLRDKVWLFKDCLEQVGVRITCQLTPDDR